MSAKKRSYFNYLFVLVAGKSFFQRFESQRKTTALF